MKRILTTYKIRNREGLIEYPYPEFDKNNIVIRILNGASQMYEMIKLSNIVKDES